MSSEEENKHAVFVRKSTTTDTGIVALAWHHASSCQPGTGLMEGIKKQNPGTQAGVLSSNSR
jgi:hypothetical protein